MRSAGSARRRSVLCRAPDAAPQPHRCAAAHAPQALVCTRLPANSPRCSCAVLRYCNISGADAVPELLPAGTCLLSTEILPSGRTAVNVALGPSVPWTGGQYDPNGGGARRLQSAAGGVQPAVLPLRRPGRQLRVVADPLIWQTFTNLESSFYRGPALAGVVEVEDEEECATACSETPFCEQWALCPTSTVVG